MHPAEWFGYQLAIHPWLRRTLSYWAATQFLTIWAMAAAPRAVAATMNTALNWTGITDSAGVPIGAYFLSTVDTLEAITNGGPDVNFYDPSTWIQWGVHSVTTGITHDTIATWIQAEASLYIFMLTAVLWLLRFSMSSTWLYWLATWFRPIFEVLHRFLTDHHFYAICLLLGVAVGAYHVLVRGHHGRGTGIILTAFAIMILGVYLLRDPIGELYSDNGLLNQARGLGFSTAQAALNNGPITTGGSATQLSQLTSQLVDALVRAPLQIWNFGTPVDDIGSCGPAWSHAILTGVRDAPAHAMQGCGAPQALGYARSIDGSIFALGLGYIVLGLLFAIFVSYVSYSYAMVIGAAFLNAILALFAAGPAMIHGAPRARARRRLKEFFRHACLRLRLRALHLIRRGHHPQDRHPRRLRQPGRHEQPRSQTRSRMPWCRPWPPASSGGSRRNSATGPAKTSPTRSPTPTTMRATDSDADDTHTTVAAHSPTTPATDSAVAATTPTNTADPHESLTTQPVKGRPPGGNPATRHPNSLRPPHQTPGHNRAPTNTPGPAPAATGSTGAEAAAAGTEAATVGAEQEPPSSPPKWPSPPRPQSRPPTTTSSIANRPSSAPRRRTAAVRPTTSPAMVDDARMQPLSRPPSRAVPPPHSQLPHQPGATADSRSAPTALRDPTNNHPGVPVTIARHRHPSPAATSRSFGPPPHRRTVTAATQRQAQCASGSVNLQARS